jgi:hypothetical protein
MPDEHVPPIEPSSGASRAGSAAAARAVLRVLERWFLHHPMRFVAAGVVLSMAWTAAVGALASAFEVERSVAPVLDAPRPVQQTLAHVLLLAPLAENAVLWLVFRAALFAALQWTTAHAGVLASALATVLFCLAHAPHKQAFGLEVAALAWLIALCFLWGWRHGRVWRGLGLSVALHGALNVAAVGLFFGATRL